MKKLKHKILIPTIASLSSLVLLVPAISSTSQAVNSSVNNSSTLNSIKYTTITYNTDSGTTPEPWTVELVGSNIVKARQEVLFSTVLKPKAKHSLNWTFKGWSTVRGDANSIIQPNATIPKAKALSLWPIFEYKAEALEIKGDDTVISSQTPTYTVESTPVATLKLTWSLSNDWAEKGTGTAPSIDASGKLTTGYDTVGTTTITVNDATSGLSATKSVSIVAPYTTKDGIWTKVTSTTNGTEWLNVSLTDLCKAQAKATTTKIDGTTGAEVTKADLDAIYIGNEQLTIPDNFCTGMSTWNKEVVFQTASKCTVIGKDFMDGCSAYTNGSQPLVLPNSVKVIDDEFLYQNNLFNVALTLPNELTYIGEGFMYECKAFNQDLTIPESVTYVGDTFMTNCDAMVSIVYVNCEATAFTIPSTPFCESLTTTNANAESYKTGIKLGGLDGIDLLTILGNRTTTPYRRLNEYHANFLTCPWAEVTLWANAVESGRKSVTELCAYFLNGTTTITSKDGFVGLERDITLNNKTHKVRVLEVQHAKDLIVEGDTVTNKTATFTFDLVNVICDGLGEGLETIWSATPNQSYIGGVLYNNLNSKNQVIWYKSGKAQDIKKSAYSMLLDAGIAPKKVQKAVATGATYTVTNYNCYCFPLTYTEMTQTTSTSAASNEGAIYTYCKNHDNDASRIKKDTKASAAARDYWAGSPNILASDNGWYASAGGSLANNVAVNNTFAISFAFCI